MSRHEAFKRLLVLLVMVLAVSGCQTWVAHFILPTENVRQPQYSVQIEHNATFRTSADIALVADIYRPRIDTAVPTILVRIPFTRTFKNGLGAEAIGRFWASRGYNVVIQGTRGRYKSGGEYYPLLYERTDGVETLRWLSRQSWFDGRLGMWGGSAFGYTQWVLADQTAPGPQALMIQIASTDFHEMFYPGGAFSLESALFWAVRSRGEKDEDPSFAALQHGFDGFPLLEADDRATQDIPFFNDWATHTRADDYWRAIDGENRARTIKSPVLLMAGWSDPFLPTQLRDFETMRRDGDPRVSAQSRLIIGPWSHADTLRFPDGSTAGDYRKASLAPSVAWFDHQLRGEPLHSSLISPVRLFVMGENVWRDEQEWPLARTQYTAFYLRSMGQANSATGNGRLSAEPPSATEPPDSYVYDPSQPVPSRGGAILGPRAGIALQNDVESRSDVLVYSSEVLERDVEVTGPLSAVLYVRTTAANTDFTVKLVDVHPGGQAYNVSDGILRRSYSPVSEPTACNEIAVQLWPTSMLFRRAHRIRVEVSSSNFPRYDRNPNTGRDIPTETVTLKATQTVCHDATTRSRIILPMVAR